MTEVQPKQVHRADLENDSTDSEMSTVRHSLEHRMGILDLEEGENWFDMIHGVFQEPSGCSGDTGVCFEVDESSGVAVRNTSQDTEISIARNADSDDDDDDEEIFTPVHSCVLEPGDKIRIFVEKFEMMLISQSIVLTYRNK